MHDTLDNGAPSGGVVRRDGGREENRMTSTHHQAATRNEAMVHEAHGTHVNISADEEPSYYSPEGIALSRGRVSRRFEG
jgi:hypothetical protein